jgi:hypothetical protein
MSKFDLQQAGLLTSRNSVLLQCSMGLDLVLSLILEEAQIALTQHSERVEQVKFVLQPRL